jgi:hypothetical protein
MIPRYIIPSLCLLLWGCLTATSPKNPSNPEQYQYYFVVPLVMSGISLMLILLMAVRFTAVRIAAQVLAVLVLLALLPYLFYFTGGI